MSVAHIREALTDPIIALYPDFTKAVGGVLDQIDAHSARVNDLLVANNRYQEEAREARAEVRRVFGGPTLMQTRMIVKAALSGETDKSGDPKYNHCLRVEEHAHDIIREWRLPGLHHDIRTVALTHDLIEDSDLDSMDLSNLGYHKSVVRAVVLLTHDEGTDYHDYIDRLCASGDYLAIVGKMADNRDNTDPKRYVGLDEDFAAYLNKRYAGVREKLETALKDLLKR